MSKTMLPVFVGIFAGAFLYELVKRNNPELGEAFKEKAKRATDRLPIPKALKEKAWSSKGH